VVTNVSEEHNTSIFRVVTTYKSAWYHNPKTTINIFTAIKNTNLNTHAMTCEDNEVQEYELLYEGS
jgi:hypothetical protein